MIGWSSLHSIERRSVYYIHYIYYIYDASGSNITGTYDYDSGYGKNSYLEYQPEADGTYYINAAGSGDDTGTYTLSVQIFADTGDDF